MSSTREPLIDNDGMWMIDGYLRYLEAEERRSDYTISRRRRILEQLNRDLPQGLGATTRRELIAWLFHDHPRWSANTVGTYRACLVDAYAFWCDADDPWLEGENPAAGLPRVRRPQGVARPCTNQQLETLLTRSPKPIRICAVLGGYQGLRACEISRLDREHVTEQILTVIKGKGGDPRVHSTDPRVWAVLRDLPPGPVVVGDDGQRLTPDQVSNRVAYWCQRKLGLTGVSMHKLRHWCGVTVQAKQGDIRVTQRVLGHKSVASTQIYTDATDAQEARARTLLPTLGGLAGG